ncbi:amidohydrolase family protein [Roseibium sp.]|uniref:amidohydrolase family protein n=1 Tax=Roseibium sp. TaxID=1936156 RepID=UPI003A98211F
MSGCGERIDAHQHFWQLSRGDYGWLTPELGPIYRDFMPADLTPLLGRNKVAGTILVQAAPTVAETRFMLDLAEANNFIKGVVGWTDFDAEDAPDRIDELARHPKLIGLRPMIQDIAQDDWLLSDHIVRALDAMVDNELVFDALTLPRHLPHLRVLLERNPDLRVVIDHGSKPEIRNRMIDPWKNEMDMIARETSAWCKISGLVTEAEPDWTIDDLRPYVDHLLAAFEPDRLIWGSDWPVCTLASSYDRWVDTCETLLDGLNADQKDKIWRRNALTAYGLDD